MNMDATILHDIFGRISRQAKLVGMGFDPAQCHLNTLLEDISQLSSKLHATAPRHVGDFDEQYAPVST